ncbi:MAG: AsmA-like C-terminal region-containing protein [Pseudomonadota bacterium]
MSEQQPQQLDDGAETLSLNARPSGAQTRPLGQRFRRGAILCLEGVAMLTGLLVILAVILGWRLSSGPLQLDFLNDDVTEALNAAAAPLSIEIGNLAMVWDNSEAALKLTARGIIARRSDGGIAAQIPQADIALDILQLMRGRWVLEEITLIDPTIRMTRLADGSLTVDLSRAATEVRDLGADRSAPAIESIVGDAGTSIIATTTNDLDQAVNAIVSILNTGTGGRASALEAVSVRDGSVLMVDQLRDRRLRVRGLDISVLRTLDGLALIGNANLQPDFAQPSIAVNGRLDLVAADMDLRGSLAVEELPISLVKEVLRLEAGFDLPELARGDTNLTGSLDWHWPAMTTADSRVARVRVAVRQGADQPLEIPLDQETALPLSGLAVVLDYDRAANRIEVTDTQVTLGEATINLAGTAVRQRDRWQVAAQVDVPSIPVPETLALFPEQTGIAGLDWSRRNFRSGVFTDLDARMALSVPVDEPGNFSIEQLTGTFAISDATVKYQWALPPASEVVGTGTFDTEAVVLTLQSGKIDTVDARDTTLTIDGFDQDYPDIVIEGFARGPFKDVMTALNHPRFGYADFLGLDLAALDGTIDAKMRFALPLRASLQAEEVEVDVAGQLIAGATNAIFADLPISDANLAMTIDGEGLKASGDVKAGGLPLTINWHQFFSLRKAVGTALDFKGSITADQLISVGLPVAPYLGGRFDLTGRVVDYNGAHTGGVTEVQAAAELTDTRITVDAAGLRDIKTTGSILANLKIEPSGGTDLSSLAIDLDLADAGPVSIAAQGRIEPDGAIGLRANRIRWGLTDVTIAFDQAVNGDLDLTIEGPRLDLRPFAAGDPASDGANADGARDWMSGGGDWVADDGHRRRLIFAVERVLMENDVVWQSVQGQAELAPQSWPSVLIQGDVGGSPLTVEMSGDRTRPLKIDINVNDLGGVLAAYDSGVPVRGGRFRFSGTGEPWSRADLVLDGAVALEEFRLADTPALAQTVTVLTEEGLVNLDPDAGFGFDRFEANLLFKDRKLQVSDGRARGGQFGFTLDGLADLEAQTLDLNGTLVPVYTLNSFIGAIPVIGTLLTGGDGEGLFAANYTVRGPFEDPDLGINPLSALAPGIIRTLLFSPQDPTIDGAQSPAQEALAPPADTVDHGG